MFTISPLLAIFAAHACRSRVVVTLLIAKRSQKQFAPSGSPPATLNGHVEEMHTGHSIVKVFGRQREAIEKFDDENERLYQASYRAQFISGIIQPAMNFIANLNYVAIAVIGGVRVASGQMTLGDVKAFIQYSRQFTMPIVQTASIMNVMQSAVASAERVFELLDEAEEVPDPVAPVIHGEAQGAVTLEDVSFRYEPDKPLIENLSLVADPGQTIAIVGPTGAGKTTLVNLLMRFYEIDGGRILGRRHRHPRHAPRQPAPDVRHGPAGHVAVQRHDPREHRLRPRGRHRGGDPGGCGGGPRRPLRPHAARRLRHRHRRRRDERLGGREAAAHHRPGVPGRSARSSSSTRPRPRSTPAPRC